MAPEHTDAGTGNVAAPMFMGEFRHKLDPKRRLTVPSGWRAAIGDSKQVVVIPRLTAKHLFVFAPHVFQAQVEKIKSSASASPERRDYMRMVSSRSELLHWDVQGRIRIRDELLARAQIDEDLVLVGAYEWFEIWSPAAWLEKTAATSESGVTQFVEDLGKF